MRNIPARMLRWWWTGCAGILAVYHFQGMLHAATSHFAPDRGSAKALAHADPAKITTVYSAAFTPHDPATAPLCLEFPATPFDVNDPAIVERVCRVTAYCDRGLTAAGTMSGVGQCAAPEDIPFGTEVYVPALNRTFVVTDRTHKRFRQNTVDIFIPSYEACRLFGRSYLECQFRLPAEAWKRPANPDSFSVAPQAVNVGPV